VTKKLNLAKLLVPVLPALPPPPEPPALLSIRVPPTGALVPPVAELVPALPPTLVEAPPVDVPAELASPPLAPPEAPPELVLRAPPGREEEPPSLLALDAEVPPRELSGLEEPPLPAPLLERVLLELEAIVLPEAESDDGLELLAPPAPEALESVWAPPLPPVLPPALSPGEEQARTVTDQVKKAVASQWRR